MNRSVSFLSVSRTHDGSATHAGAKDQVGDFFIYIICFGNGRKAQAPVFFTWFFKKTGVF